MGCRYLKHEINQKTDDNQFFTRQEYLLNIESCSRYKQVNLWAFHIK